MSKALKSAHQASASKNSAAASSPKPPPPPANVPAPAPVAPVEKGAKRAAYKASAPKRAAKMLARIAKFLGRFAAAARRNGEPAIEGTLTQLASGIDTDLIAGVAAIPAEKFQRDPSERGHGGGGGARKTRVTPVRGGIYTVPPKLRARVAERELLDNENALIAVTVVKVVGKKVIVRVAELDSDGKVAFDSDGVPTFGERITLVGSMLRACV